VNAPLCDIAEIFRQESPEGATGWALLDDHVHLSLVGQARAARAMASGLAKSLSIDESALQAVPDDATLARKLGSNYYDTYRVNHTLRVLFGVSFMRESNPEAYARFSKAVEEAESEMPQEILEVAHSWQTMTPHAGGLRPITGMIARVLLRQNRAVDALPLYDTAAKQVPDYTSWYIEYVYFSLACRERLDGLREEDHTTARHALVQGRFLLAKGDSQTGLTERYLGRIHQLLGEWEQAIPLLLAARPKLSNEDLVACDQALVASYIKTGKKNEAQALVDDGIKNSGKFSSIYTAMGQQIR
jgi:tetratricopeptide (TPR) repeat protein